MADEPVNTGIEENADGLAITPEGDGAQTPEPIIAITPEGDGEKTPEPIITADEHGEELPTVDDPNAMRAWIGRRDKRLRDEYDVKLKQTVDYVVQGIQQSQQQQVQPQPIPAQEDINLEDLDFINDPKGSFLKLFNNVAPAFATDYIPKYNAEYSAKMEQKANQVLSGIGFLAKNDPFLKDDSDRIIEIAKKLPFYGNADSTMEAKATFTEAQNILLREKMQKKINPLTGNKPATQPIGSISPTNPAKSVAPRVNLSQEVKNEGFKMGLTEEKMYELLKD